MYWLYCAACGILVPDCPGIEPVPLAMKGWNPNPRTVREFPLWSYKVE